MSAALLFDSSSVSVENSFDVLISFDGLQLANLPGVNISLSDEIELHDELLREKYLSFVHQIGMTQVKGRSIINHLQISQSFSFWWLTLFALRRWHNASGIVQALKLFALEQTLISHAITSLHVDLSDPAVQKCVMKLCRNHGIAVTSGRKLSLGARVPQPLLAAATFIRHNCRKFPIISATTPTLPEPGITLIDYFNGFDFNSASDGEYRSRFWANLPALVQKTFAATRWLHIRDVGSQSLTVAEAKNFSNSLSTPLNIHSAIDLIDMNRIRCRVAFSYFRLVKSSINIKSVRFAFTPADSKLDLWPIFSSEWNQSLRGAVAIQHIAQFHAMNRRLSALPHQSCGMYLMENQPWEMALIAHWKICGHGTLVGVPHAAPKFWEVRRFVDPQSRTDKDIAVFPQPDFIATNSAVMQQDLLDNGIPERNLIPVEALAFAHMTSLYKQVNNEVALSRIAILGDFSRVVTDRLLEMIGELSSKLPSGIVFKSHPACAVNSSELDRIGLHLFNGDIADLLSQCDVIITTSSTSAALEAYCLGKPVIMLTDGMHLTMSPLRKADGVYFVHTADDLLNALNRARSLGMQPKREFFNLDEELPMWAAFLTDLARH